MCNSCVVFWFDPEIDLEFVPRLTVADMLRDAVAVIGVRGTLQEVLS